MNEKNSLIIYHKAGFLSEESINIIVIIATHSSKTTTIKYKKPMKVVDNRPSNLENSPPSRRVGRAVECTGLENSCN